jgi:hypothetical protein
VLVTPLPPEPVASPPEEPVLSPLVAEPVTSPPVPDVWLPELVCDVPLAVAAAPLSSLLQPAIASEKKAIPSARFIMTRKCPGPSEAGPQFEPARVAVTKREPPGRGETTVPFAWAECCARPEIG